MKHSIRITAAVALAAAAMLAAPVAAQATPIYPPGNACTVAPPTVTPGATVQFSCDDGTFSPNEAVTVTVEGATSASIGFLRFDVTSSAGKVSTATGALASVPISFPSNASGVYNITAVSDTSSGGTASVTVSTTGAGAGGSTGGSTGGLATTGFESAALMGAWVGGGALVLAGGALAVAAAVRRNRKHAEI